MGVAIFSSCLMQEDQNAIHDPATCAPSPCKLPKVKGAAEIVPACSGASACSRRQEGVGESGGRSILEVGVSQPA